MTRSDDEDNTLIYSGQATQVPGLSGVVVSYAPGAIVDDTYKLINFLGQGGMGAVFSCKHIALNQDYAIKLLSAQQLTSEAWQRFEIEAKVLAKLKHPNIVSIYNMGIDKNNCPYYVMDLLHGETLDLWIKDRQRLPIERCMQIFITAAEALASVHGKGIVHRDIKPSNLFITRQTRAQPEILKIFDFGIARDAKSNVEIQSQTATGLIFGTPYYMSPEQCQASQVDSRSDIYSLGCALFESLTGRPPFIGKTALETFWLHENAPPPTLSAAAQRMTNSTKEILFPPALELAVQKMLRKEVKERYQTMEQVSHDLQRINSGKSIGGRRDIRSDLGEQKSDHSNSDEQFASKDETRNVLYSQASISENKNKKRPIGAKTKLALVFLNSLILFAAFFSISNGKLSAVLPKTSAAQESQKSVPLTPAITKAAAPAKEIEVSSNTADQDDSAILHKDVPGRPSHELIAFGATDAELRDVSPDKTKDFETSFFSFETLWLEHQRNAGQFREDARPNALHFPEDIVIGDVSINLRKPIFATGRISTTPPDQVFLYLTTPTRKFPSLMQRFYPNDLTGLAVITDFPDQILKELKNWNRLSELDFFNPLLKALPGRTEVWDESKLRDQNLPAIDRFAQEHHLSGLGLCQAVSGPAVAKMDILKTLKSLKLKRIENFQPLLLSLPQYDNLNELWLVDQKINDEQVKILARIKNLKRLTIRRSNLSPASYQSFKTMHTLKFLTIDRNNWTADQKSEFAKHLPNCLVRWEPVAETLYWKTTNLVLSSY